MFLNNICKIVHLKTKIPNLLYIRFIYFYISFGVSSIGLECNRKKGTIISVQLYPQTRMPILDDVQYCFVFYHYYFPNMKCQFLTCYMISAWRQQHVTVG